jgi:hypothetical protein
MQILNNFIFSLGIRKLEMSKEKPEQLFTHTFSLLRAFSNSAITE